MLSTGPNAAEGLVIFNTTNNCLEFWNVEKWLSLCESICDKLVQPEAIIIAVDIVQNKDKLVTEVDIPCFTSA